MTDTIEQLDAELFDAIRAERDGRNTLILRKLDKPFRRFDKVMAHYELEYRWHRSEEAEVCEVLGNDFSFWAEGELDTDQSMFEQVNL